MQEDSISLLTKQRVLETSIAESLERTAGTTMNPIVRLIVTALVLDSKKHAAILQALIDAKFDGKLVETEKEDMRKALRAHLAGETDMLNKINNLIEVTKDPLIKAGLQRIAQDETRHHKMIEKLMELFSGDVGKTLDRWQLLLKESATGC